jgi:lactoylglutathione lyase
VRGDEDYSGRRRVGAASREIEAAFASEINVHEHDLGSRFVDSPNPIRPCILHAMGAIRLNHVSISARDLEESIRFYAEIFGMERIPSPTFRHPVAWLRLGDQQLHLFQRETSAPEFHHIGIDVDDFESVYVRTKELGIQESDSWFSHIYELPDGSVQFYLRDPGGNLVEVDWPDGATLDRSVVGDIKRLADDVEQSAESLRATLYLRAQG